MKKSRKALLSSVLALVLCFSMLLGTTFAWFTDSVTSSNNIIKAGNLDIELYYQVEGQSDWTKVTEATNIFMEDALWEPGHTEVVKLKVVNEGSLALKYQLGVNIAGETGSKNVNGADFKLSQFIYYGIVEGEKTYTRDEAIAAVAGSAKPLNTAYSTSSTKLLAKNDGDTDETIVTMVVYMPTAVENDANHAKDAPVPTIKLGLNLIATQVEEESDSFGKNYDADSEYPVVINFSVAQPIDAAKVENGALKEEMTVGDTKGDIYAEVPAGVKLADGATVLELSVKTMDESEADITLDEGERATSLDIHVEGMHEDNDVPVFVTLEGYFKKNLNSTSVVMYHVEDGVTKKMDLVSLAELDAHNEFYYDPATGNVVICTATFSEYTVVTNSLNPWEGQNDISWYNDTDSEFTLTTADQLAGFGQLVDEGNSFAGKTVNLGADIDLGGTISFNPIGWGYANADYNQGGEAGKSFRGTFDGNNFTVYGLYQSGWELGYSYTNCGGGLFASIANGTVQNLTIRGANIVMECVEQGILVGLSQGNCTYDNIKIYDSKVANYQRATGGLIGEVSPLNGGGTTTISNVVIGSDVVVGSLWGDFDAPVGGVIGARWDDGNTTEIVMNNVIVACRLDVYNDVTSSYQWYAYRRAGMLIGNTDTPPANGKDSATATADFLTCADVVVKYGDWVNYHYCEFNNHNSSWPWVRVEAGENCSAYSNPRYGVPNDPVTNQPVTSLDHNHSDDDEHYVELKFNQLYGGGQGVYGKADHSGVTVQDYYYTVTYINDSQIVATDQVATLEAYNPLTVVPTVDGKSVEYWENAYSQMIFEIPAGNMSDYTLYPKIEGEYVVRFLTADETVIGWGQFNESGVFSMYEGTTAISTDTTPAVPDIGEGFTGYWATKDGVKWENWSHSGVTNDVLFYAYYNSSTLNLTPIYDENDVQIAYAVAGPQSHTEKNLVIPDVVNGYPVTTVSGDAFAGFDDLMAVRIPVSVETIGSDAFAEEKYNPDLGWFNSEVNRDRQTITFYYEGTQDQWDAMDKQAAWDNSMGEGSRVFFLDASGNVDLEQGYLELANTGSKTNPNFVWQYHAHAFPNVSDYGCSNEHNQNDTPYTDGTREDYEYWS